MAPNGGHLLVGKTVRLLRLAAEKAARVVRDKLPQVSQPLEAYAEPVYARSSTTKPIHRIAALRQSHGGSFLAHRGAVRQFSSTGQKSSKQLRASYPPSRTATKISQLTSRTPFASTLRPNLTGGTLSRTSGGYNIGAGRVNGARYFSHCPTSPVEVVQSVSQAVRAFWLSGQKAHFDGYNPRTGEKRFRAVSNVQDEARQKLDMSHANAPGSFVDFKVSPTITAVGPLSAVPRVSSRASCDYGFTQEDEVNNIANETLITTLETDFARALKNLAAIMNDLKRLACLGSLPLVLLDGNTLRVRFPGCDKDIVESLCLELNIRRGIVGQDPDLDEKCGAEMALLFPFCPSRTPSEDFQFVFESENRRPAKKPRREDVDWQGMMSPVHKASPGYSQRSVRSRDISDDAVIINDPLLSSPSGYSSLQASDEDRETVAAMFFQPPAASRQYKSAGNKSHTSGYEGFEGIYRFIEQCDSAQR